MSTATAPSSAVFAVTPSCTPDLKPSCTSINTSGSNAFVEISASQSMTAIEGAIVIAQKNVSPAQVDSMCMDINASLLIFQVVLDDDEVCNKVCESCDSRSVKNAKDVSQSVSTRASRLCKETDMIATVGFEPVMLQLIHTCADEHLDVIMTGFGSNDFKCKHQGQREPGGVGNSSYEDAGRTNGSSDSVALKQTLGSV